MSNFSTVASREALRARHLAPANALVRELIAATQLDDAARARIRKHAIALATAARDQTADDGFALSLVHRFGLDTPQGIALMQLAEALPRTIAPETAHALLTDKVGSLSWRDAVGTTSKFGERLALHALDILSKIFRESRPRSTVQRIALRAVKRTIAILGRQYVLGETLASAYRTGASLARTGYSFSFDMLGEAALTDAAAQHYQRSYLDAVDSLAARGDTRNAISVKLSALHPRFEERQRATTLPILLQRVREIATRARNANLQLTIDAEESDRLELTLDLFEQLLATPDLQGWNGLGLAVQAYQRRAPAVIDLLDELATRSGVRINVRLVKGAYWDTEIKRTQQLGLSDYPIFVRKCDTDVSYLACARRLLERSKSFFPQFATHNAHTVAAVVELASQTANTQFEFQRLHGMGEHLHTALLREGYASRIYAPVGPQRELLPYLVRRLLENGAGSSFVRQLTDTSIPIERLARDPALLATTHVLSRVGVLRPRSPFNQSWTTARGTDLARRETSTAIANAIVSPQPLIQAGPLLSGVLQMGESHSITNPAVRDQIIGQVITATATQLDAAVSASRAALRSWSDTTPATRALTLERAARLLEERANEFIRLAVIEAGKTQDDAIGEVREAVDFCRYYAEQCRSPAMSDRQPLGVVVCVSPWNFPLAIFLGQVTGALAAGNAVIAKPAEQTPLIAVLATRLLHEAGIPNEVLHLLPGDGSVGAALVQHRDIDGVVFTGSVATAKAIANSLATTHRGALPFIGETGGINAMIVDCSALAEQVVRDVLTSAFQSAGQRCSALRVLCVQNDVADHVLSLLKGALAQLKVGDPAHLDTDVGPLIDAEAQQQVTRYLQSRTAFASASLDPRSAARGTFVAPTIVEVKRIADVEREVFGPVLHVVRFAAAELQSVVAQVNLLGYGLTLGIQTRIRQRAQLIADDASIGNVYVNRHQVAAVVGQQPFGGHDLSGTGPKAGGPHYLLRLSRRAAALVEAQYQLTLTADPVDAPVRAMLAAARKAQRVWEQTARRVERVQFVCELLAANTSHPLSAAAARVRLPDAADLAPTLAHIAGETNVLRMRPRGVLLCIDPSAHSLDTLATQVLMSIALGNGVMAVVCKERAQDLRELIAELQQIGVQESLVACIETTSTQISSSWLVELDIDGVVFDGNPEDRHRVAAALNGRAGRLLPLLSSGDDVYRFGLEQTVTTNTAAAGGDPTLLALSG